ncbi:MAG: rod shape-determining protein [Candidatus Tagabacteria bacterium RIFCSPLOWO2_01_FULL_42_9]|uniref:Cell shape-determining protein MreB n=1 Tax=Candidatus Tagabacteria bacterium RIFCSPLOWO2_01_FULL_42_9 TaxID=1802296 RepID=A0A1G2LUM5_9BACT|nr:MAG: rod shape-determining protein [Candidatus Tagabacteria bacterium RIFCSPLOWO2_01_FULL_42_9]
MALFVRKLGVDLGTANSLVFVPGKGIALNEPSVVAVLVPENKVLAVGNEAKAMIGKTPDTIIAYRPLKDGVIADYRVTESMMRFFIKKSLGPWNIFKPEIMISVPASVSSTERRSVIEAAVKAGAKSAYVVKEPVLAAIGAGIPIQEARGHMVVEIGGGTTDIAVISLGGIVASASAKIAGNAIDQAIADYIKKTFNLAIGDQTAEEIKIAVGSAVPVENELKYKIKGRDFLTGLPRSADVSTNEVLKAIEGELRDIMKTIKTVLQDTPPELASDIIDQGISMSGGGSLLRNICELVYQSTGVKAQLVEDPLLAVARGTGIALEHLDSYKRSIISKP